METFFKIKITSMLAMLVAALSLTACSSDDDEVVREGLTQNGITLTASTVSSLSFSWETVENATQYGYRLLDADGNAIDGGITTGTAVSFTKLSDDTEYAFELTAFAAYNGKYSNGEVETINVKTDKKVPLSSPTLTSEVNYEKVSVSWEAVENADTYYVKVAVSDGTEKNDTITSTSYSFTGTVGLTYTVSVSAYTEAEAYSQSEWSTTEELAPVQNPRKEIWRVTGEFKETDITGTTSTRTLVAYDDGTYELLDFIYEGTGYNLQFSVNDDGSINILNGETPVNGYIPVTCYDNYVCYIYPGAGYNKFDAEAGSFWYYSYSYNGGYSEFTWNKDDIVYPYGKRVKVCDVTYGNTTYPTRFDDVKSSSIYIVDGENKFVWADFLDSGIDLLFTVDTSHSGAVFDANNIQSLKGDIIPLNYYYKDTYGYHFVEDGSGESDYENRYITWIPEGQSEAVTSFYFYGYYGGSYSYIDFDKGSYDCGYGYFWSAWVNGAGYENIYFYLYY